MSGIDRSRASTMIGHHHEGDEEEDPIVRFDWLKNRFSTLIDLW